MKLGQTGTEFGQIFRSEKSAKVIEGTIEIRDIAGLVKGANSGLGK